MPRFVAGSKIVSEGSAKGNSRPWIDRHTVDQYEPNCCCPFGNPEAVGYVFAGSVFAGVATMANIFFSAAVLELATVEAGCASLQADDDVDDDCHGRVYGLKPANVYVVVTLTGALVVAIIQPLAGAIIDNTRFRKSVAAYALMGLALTTWVQVFISKGNWFFMCCLQIPSIAFYMIHMLAISAYLPELSDEQTELTKAGSVSAKYLFVTEVTYVLVITVVGQILFGPGDSLNTCRLSQALCG